MKYLLPKRVEGPDTAAMAGGRRNRRGEAGRVRLRVYATAEQRLAIRERAAAAGVSESRYLLTVGLNRRLATPARVDLETLLELARIGNNLNQLTHLAHANRLPERLADPLPALKEVLDALRHELAVGTQ